MSQKDIVIGYTTGVFDMFHIGHLNILKKSKELCDYLIVGVTTDELTYSRKQKYPVICQDDRMSIIQSIKYVDRAVWQSDMDKLKAVVENKVDVVFVGSDWKGTKEWEKYEKEFAEVNCKVIYLDYTEGISSTFLRDKLNII